MSIGNLPEVLSQRVLAGMILAGRRPRGEDKLDTLRNLLVTGTEGPGHASPGRADVSGGRLRLPALRLSPQPPAFFADACISTLVPLGMGKLVTS